MSSQEKKPCIQERIKDLFERIIFNPMRLATVSLVLFFLLFSLFYIADLLTLDYNRTRDLVELIVMTDASIIAFTGVIASMILKHGLEEERQRVNDITRTIMETVVRKVYREIRSRTIYFVSITMIMLVGSILSGMVAIITQNFIITILLSLDLLFTGIIELLVMLAYSLWFELH